MKGILLFIVLINAFSTGMAQHTRIALLKYNGGGDWYADPTALPNLIDFCNKQLNTTIHPEP